MGLFSPIKIPGRMEAAGPDISKVAQESAAKIAPGLVQEAIANQDTVLGEIGNPVFRMAAKKAYPFLMDQIPPTTGIVVDRLLSTMTKMSVPELVSMVVAHANQKNETIHPSLESYVPPLRNPLG